MGHSMGRLEGLCAVVTGAGSGFGRGIASAFAQEGAAVLVADIDAQAAEATAEALRSAGGRAAAHTADVTDPAGLEAMVGTCEALFGGLDIMVANAGIGQRPARLLDTGAETLRRQFEVNAIGAAQTCRAALPALHRRGGGSILITVSGIALVPRPNLYGYGMAKSAAMYLMKSLALELAPEKIRVNGLFRPSATPPCWRNSPAARAATKRTGSLRRPCLSGG